MRMEELKDESYIKSADTVERYLLDIIRQYFVDHVEVPETSRESFIHDALEVMKEEVDFDTLGVLSISLPNGETRIGNVSLTLEDLNGEPKIQVKNSAFNVNFGTEASTACEGNDPRLFDARTPIAHTHTISEIYGLSSKISTLDTLIETINEYAHTHSNKEVLDKITYSGTKSVVDITIIETLTDKVNEVINTVNTTVQSFCDEVNTRLTTVEDKIRQLSTNTDNLLETLRVSNFQNMEEVSNEVDRKLAEATTAVRTSADSRYVSKHAFQNLIDSINNLYFYIATDTFNLSNVIPTTAAFGNTINIGNIAITKNKVEDNGGNFSNALFDIYVLKNNVRYVLPCIIYKSDEPVGTINVNINNSTGILNLTFNCSYENYRTSSIFGGNLIVDTYAQKRLG